MTEVCVRGVRYELDVTGDGPAVLLLHGFTGTRDTWRPHLGALRGFEAIAVDLLGHGGSDAPEDPARYGMEETVADLLAVLDALEVRRAAVVGYSMGGRVALRLALRAPDRCWALVLESASPGIADEAERAARIAADEALAELLEREGIAAFVAHWESLPLWASQARLPEEVRAHLRRQRLQQRPLGLANSLRGLGAGRDLPVFGRLGELPMPVLLVTGGLDTKYVNLAREMAARIPNVRWVNVPDVGHAVHLEAPAAFAEALRTFLVAHAHPILPPEVSR